MRKATSNRLTASWDRVSGRLMTEFLPFVVGMSWLDQLKQPRSDTGDGHADYDVQSRTMSAFLIEVQGVWMLVTAGHVISFFKEVTSGARKFLKGRLFDNMGAVQRFEAIPFDFDKTPLFHVDLEDVGWDLGAIPLSHMYVELLRKTGRRAFGAGQIAALGDEFDRYVVLGFPFEHQRIKRRRAGTRTTLDITFGSPLLPVRRLKRAPKELKKPLPRLYGKILRDRFVWNEQTMILENINGMSGGPIIGVRLKRNRIEYALVAVQSGWLPSKRVLAGCPLSNLGDVVLERMRKAGARV